VTWLRDSGPEGQSGMGIQFTGVMGPLLLEMVRAARGQ
jgi:hypothetical protein